ncbi:uncharacterized protein RCC_09430 [Ramularia collo-cygni]|uniref:Methyltransferase domain-containing protein n=1 Tax=Ramularia collo-cygni TaxID=112498 RepID=A0A2D3V2W6_9PEZI|nr:uncharacterized protein RCC_09430 [Ramularia collo-cygni]CZT23716.1 uncharacterized protein RCC_09430 [Ramularia collo-cygni]
MAPSDYVFNRDYLDNNRINLQHYLWREIFGYLIHPSIPTGAPDLKIADVGTGTGIWLTELADRLPSAQLDGLDVSFDALPPCKWLPQNVRRLHWDVTHDVPPELEGQYDLVHIRLFAFVLLNDDLPGVLERLAKLLKPGGYLQWDEPDIASFRIETTDSTISTEALKQLVERMQPQDVRFSPTWIARLPDLFKNAGFECVQYDVREAKPWLALAMHEDNLMIHEVIAAKSKDAAF